MLDELRAREERLKQREAEVADRAQALSVAKSEIDGRLAELLAAEEKLSATLTLADDAADEDVARLVTVYEKMKPKDAASLFAEMDPDFAAGFVARMRPDAAAAVMAGLDPKEAYTISVVLAGRNANAPRE
jgi:flagellar motility protein MotE (MotC chaperone)